MRTRWAAPRQRARRRPAADCRPAVGRPRARLLRVKLLSEWAAAAARARHGVPVPPLPARCLAGLARPARPTAGRAPARQASIPGVGSLPGLRRASPGLIAVA